MPVAVNCLLVFSASVGSAGVIAMDLSCAPELLVDTSRLAVPPPLPHPTRTVMSNDTSSMKYDFLFNILCSSSCFMEKNGHE
jgi:hypothetical protein